MSYNTRNTNTNNYINDNNNDNDKHNNNNITNNNDNNDNKDDSDNSIIQSIFEISSCLLGRDPGTLKSDIVSKKHPRLICSDLRLSN